MSPLRATLLAASLRMNTFGAGSIRVEGRLRSGIQRSEERHVDTRRTIKHRVLADAARISHQPESSCGTTY